MTAERSCTRAREASVLPVRQIASRPHPGCPAPIRALLVVTLLMGYAGSCFALRC